jgi:hypothetical protein
MNNFDYGNIKSLNLNFNGPTWNSKTHSVFVQHDPNAPNKFVIKMVPIYPEPAVNTLDDAQAVLNKFRLKK